MIYIKAFILPMIIIILIGNIFIKFIKNINFGQQIREYGPESHLEKAGIPTMGGLMIVFTFLLITSIIIDLELNTAVVLFTTFFMGLAGFLDDFLKIKFSRSLGLKAWQKLTLQTLAALIVAIVLIYFNDTPPLLLPFFNSFELNSILRFTLTLFVVIGTANAVNLTDGLDGLAASVTVIVSLSFAIIFYLLALEEFMIMMLIMAGSCMAFLWFNSYPAEIFMGDVGSLAIGGFLASTAVLTGTEFFLFVIGFIYVIETLSVMIQVPYYKLTGGKRFFKMTPIHHHFELGGTAENKIVVRFVIITIILALLSLSSFL
ncbi:phospho-N-acetylmuramoyl-pentapeptide-transferase [Halanaerobium hydrogeniformans]|uniref:Phospho-N-acetylmuramoyl-pentapeptide-transferase n=1 Tax=Halanaerobium hydrogeniformans TaxID=656519 RepID=E4RIG2_HALHG|nr:phospho-N-acetylmuramoyl-pentapeptide-transferase [Halanaerobium hydrogeniformans]ADQ15032.1 phospho-N-acetylmuramoyl-pentapeptide-transferase [Halanaerobium hydrogeniformans]